MAHNFSSATIYSTKLEHVFHVQVHVHTHEPHLCSNGPLELPNLMCTERDLKGIADQAVVALLRLGHDANAAAANGVRHLCTGQLRAVTRERWSM